MSRLLSRPILKEDMAPWILGYALEQLYSTRLEIGRTRALLPCRYGTGRPRRWKLSTWSGAVVQTERTRASETQEGSLVYLLEATDGILSMLSHLFWVLELCNELLMSVSRIVGVGSSLIRNPSLACNDFRLPCRFSSRHLVPASASSSRHVVHKFHNQRKTQLALQSFPSRHPPRTSRN